MDSPSEHLWQLEDLHIGIVLLKTLPVFTRQIDPQLDQKKHKNEYRNLNAIILKQSL